MQFTTIKKQNKKSNTNGQQTNYFFLIYCLLCVVCFLVVCRLFVCLLVGLFVVCLFVCLFVVLSFHGAFWAYFLPPVCGGACGGGACSCLLVVCCLAAVCQCWHVSHSLVAVLPASPIGRAGCSVRELGSLIGIVCCFVGWSVCFLLVVVNGALNNKRH